MQLFILFALLLAKLTISKTIQDIPLYDEDLKEEENPSPKYYFGLPEIIYGTDKSKREVDETLDDPASLRAASTTKSPILQGIQNMTQSLNSTWNTLAKDPMKFFEEWIQNSKNSLGESPELILKGGATYKAPMPNMLDGLQMFMHFVKMMRPQS